MESILVYGISFSLCVLFAFLSEKYQKRGLLICAAFILSFVCGCRAASVGNDTANYYTAFDGLCRKGDMNYGSLAAMEVSFRYITKGISLLFPSAQFIMFVYALLTIGLVFLRIWDFHESCSIPWSILAFLLSPYFFVQSGLRQACALAIVFYGTRYLDKKKYTLFLVFLVCACLFHTSASISIIFLLFECFRWKNLKLSHKLMFSAAIALVPIAYIFLSRRIETTYAQYFDMQHTRLGMGMFVKFAFAVFAIIFAQTNYSSVPQQHEVEKLAVSNCKYIREQRKKKPQSVVESPRYLFGMISIYYCVGILSQISGYFYYNIARIGLYLYWFEMVFMGMVAKSKENRIILQICVFVMLLYVFVVGIQGNGYNQVPYLFFWQK